MAKIFVEPDCGNAPRKNFLRDFAIILANGELDQLSSNIPDKIIWNIIGYKLIEGKENYLSFIGQSENWDLTELHIEEIITHGDDASISGFFYQKSGTKYAFCEIVSFTGSKG